MHVQTSFRIWVYFAVILGFLALVSLPLTTAQTFGVSSGGASAAEEAVIDPDGTTELPSYMEMANKLRSFAPIDMQDAVDLAVVLEAAQADPETATLIAQLKTKGSEAGTSMENLSKDVTQMEVVQGLKASLDELKAIEALFVDPQRAVLELEKDGLLGDKKKSVEYYKENPEILADELRKGTYFGFVAVAVAGGFLE